MQSVLEMAAHNVTDVTEEDRNLLLQRYLDIEWCDDVTDLRCVRCHRVAINHHMSNCQHLFCDNCRRVFSDGGRWKCPQCQQYVTQLDEQDVDIEYQLFQMRVYCPNRKYGCQLTDQLTIIARHLKDCKNTRESALPMEYTGTNTVDILYRYVSGLGELLRQVSYEMREMKSESEANWKQVQVKMDEMGLKVDTTVKDLYAQTKRLTNCEMQLKGAVSDMKKTPMLEEMREEIEKMKLKLTKMALKAKENLITVHTIKGSLNEQLKENDAKLTKKLNKYENDIKNTMDIYKDQLRDVKTTVASMNTEQQTNHQAIGQINVKITELNNSLRKQTEQLSIMEQHGKGDITRTIEQLETIKARMKQSEAFIMAELMSNETILKECQAKLEKTPQIHKDGDELQRKLKLIEAEMKAVPALPLLPEQVIRLNTEIYEWNIKTPRTSEPILDQRTKVLQILEYPFGLQFKFNVYPDGKAGISNQLVDVYNTRQPIIQPMPNIIYIIQDQSDNSWYRKRDAVIYDNYGFASPLEYEDFTGHRSLVDYSRLLNAPYNKNGSIRIKILVEPPSIANSFASNDGVLYWRVDNYRKRKQMEEEGLVKYQESPYFYTAPQGYRVGALINLNTMTAGIEAYKGKYDEKLTQHLKYRTTITLFNQTDPSMNLVNSYKHNILDKGLRFQLCNDQQEFEKTGYVKSDSVLLKFVVEPLSN